MSLAKLRLCGWSFERLQEIGHLGEFEMNREQALPYVSYCLDDALTVTYDYTKEEIPKDAVLVGWQCGFEPMFVAVWSYLGGKLDADSAEEIATDYLQEIGWFDRLTEDDEPPIADYIIVE